MVHKLVQKKIRRETNKLVQKAYVNTEISKATSWTIADRQRLLHKVHHLHHAKED